MHSTNSLFVSPLPFRPKYRLCLCVSTARSRQAVELVGFILWEGILYSFTAKFMMQMNILLISYSISLESSYESLIKPHACHCSVPLFQSWRNGSARSIAFRCDFRFKNWIFLVFNFGDELVCLWWISLTKDGRCAPPSGQWPGIRLVFCVPIKVPSTSLITMLIRFLSVARPKFDHETNRRSNRSIDWYASPARTKTHHPGHHCIDTQREWRCAWKRAYPPQPHCCLCCFRCSTSSQNDQPYIMILQQQHCLKSLFSAEYCSKLLHFGKRCKR